MNLLYHVLVFVVIVSMFGVVDANISFCYKKDKHFIIKTQNSAQLVRIGRLQCPGGLFFEEPTKIFAITANSTRRFCIKETLCGNDPGRNDWSCETKMEESTVQLLSTIDVETMSSSSGFIFYQECSSDLIQDGNLDSNSVRKKRWTREEEEDTKDESPSPPELIDQTKRMFYFLANLNPESVKSEFRAVALMEKTVELVNIICDSGFLNPAFIQEVLRGFLFLLKEQGTEGIGEIENDDFVNLTEALDACTVTPNPITFTGLGCQLEMKVETISRLVNGEIQTVAYAPTESSFQWGKYDLIIDAMWTAVNIVHGICFTTFRPSINLHHKYQVTMESLFKKDILSRWTKPLDLYRNYEYDHILLAPVNESMEILDACTVGAYLSSPFRHRLSRPMVLPQPQRHRRSSVTTSNDLERQDVTAHCFQSIAEKEDALKFFCQ